MEKEKVTTMTTIRLYGFIELDLKLVKGLGREEINEFLEREARSVIRSMKEDFWDSYKPTM